MADKDYKLPNPFSYTIIQVVLLVLYYGNYINMPKWVAWFPSIVIGIILGIILIIALIGLSLWAIGELL